MLCGLQHCKIDRCSTRLGPPALVRIVHRRQWLALVVVSVGSIVAQLGYINKCGTVSAHPASQSPACRTSNARRAHRRSEGDGQSERPAWLSAASACAVRTLVRVAQQGPPGSDFKAAPHSRAAVRVWGAGEFSRRAACFYVLCGAAQVDEQQDRMLGLTLDRVVGIGLALSCCLSSAGIAPSSRPSA